MHEAKAIKKEKIEKCTVFFKETRDLRAWMDWAVLGGATVSHAPWGLMATHRSLLNRHAHRLNSFFFFFLHMCGVDASISYPPMTDPGFLFSKLREHLFSFLQFSMVIACHWFIHPGHWNWSPHNSNINWDRRGIQRWAHRHVCMQM